MSEQEKKRQKIYDLLNTETKPTFLCLPYTKQRKFFYRNRVFFSLNKKPKEGFITFLAMVITKRTTMSVRKHAYE